MKFKVSLLIFLSLLACSNSRISSVGREDLFSLEIGPMEDQIALYNLDGSRGIRRIGFTMRDGLFYIVDGNIGKIIRFNSFGDLQFMIYNDHTNPPPVSLRTNITENEFATRWAHSYPLEEPGWITVDSKKNIFVEDRLPYHARRVDSENNAVLDGVILHFDQDGRFVNYLGQDGIGGNPFPRIVGLTTTVRDELAVICRLSDSWHIYWFNSEGHHLFLIKIDSRTIPELADWPEALAVIDSIAASVDSRHLYVKIDYSRDVFDFSTNIRTGSEPITSLIWTLNIEDGTYIRYTEVPLYEIYNEQRGRSTRVFYSLLGVSRAGKVLMYFPEETGYALLLADTHTNQQRRSNIQFTYDEIRYNDFYLSHEGILTAMLADNYNVKMVWWRTDRFLGELP